MKLVSLKTLLASLLGCTFVVMKMMTFDGLVDMFWIIFIGYLTVKAMVTAFSEEAYDEDIRQVQQRKVLYRDLFGKFAYIAADVPILLILLAGFLASVCSVTTLLRATLIGLLLIAVGYAIWFSWYVSKHKRLRMENGEWGTGILSAEDEKAWKLSNLWHGIILGIAGVLFALYLIFGSVSEGMNHVVFTNRGRVVASVCTHPASTGYYLSFTGGENTYYSYSDGGYSNIEYGDEIVFEVMQDDGFVRLHARVEE